MFIIQDKSLIKLSYIFIVKTYKHSLWEITKNYIFTIPNSIDNMMSDTIEKIKCLIIGSGPAGYTAAIYAASCINCGSITGRTRTYN